MGRRDYAAYLASPDWRQHRADRLVDRRRMPPTGAARLLKALVMRELEPAALPAAALLVVALDDQARADSRVV